MYLTAFVLALTLTTGLGSPIVQYEGNEANSSELVRLKVLMKAFFNWFAPQIDNRLKDDHLPKNLKNARFKSDSLDADIVFTYLIFEREANAKASIDNYEITPSTLTTTFRIEIPQRSVTYKYKLNGRCLGHKVHGEGHFTYEMKNISLTVSDLTFHDHPHNIQIASIKLLGDVDDFTVKFSGLKVDKMDYEKFEKVLQARILHRIKEMGHISEAQAAEIEGDLDVHMFGKSLTQVVQWLRRHTKRISIF